MADVMQHRGSGENIFYLDNQASLGWLPSERPGPGASEELLTDEERRYQIIFDGSVYNHSYLRWELKNRGHLFKTKNDFEVILHLYEEMGRRCPEKLRGPFAFAIWDSKKKILYLARDRFGIKPLYYAKAACLLYTSRCV